LAADDHHIPNSTLHISSVLLSGKDGSPTLNPREIERDKDLYENGGIVGQIRLKYSGLVSLASKIFSVFTGVIFTLTVTRRLSTSEFGVWALMGYLASYFIWPSWIANFWATRYTARNVVNAPKTAIGTNTIVSAFAALLYLPLSAFVAGKMGADSIPFLLYGLFIVLSSIESALESVAYAKKPQIIGFSFLFFETIKVVCALILVALLRLALVGAALSIILALIAQTAVLTLRLADLVSHGEFELNLARRWVSHGWLAIYNNLPSVVSGLDRIIVVLLAGASISLAYLGVSGTLSAVVGFGSSLAVALYPRLLSGGSKEDIETVLRMVLMFIIPASLGIICLSEPLLALFRPEYTVAKLPLYILISASFLGVIENIINLSLMGIEKADIAEKISLRDFTKSSLFKLPSFNLASLLFYLPAVAVVSLSFQRDQLQLATMWSLLILAIQIPVLIAKLAYARTLIRPRIPLRDVMKFLVSGLFMVAVVSVLWRNGDYSNPIYLLASRLAPTIFIGMVSYFSFLFLLDAEFRKLAHQAIKDLRSRVQGIKFS
jgi:O-antigen/teichoic acid export membrane protein